MTVVVHVTSCLNTALQDIMGSAYLHRLMTMANARDECVFKYGPNADPRLLLYRHVETLEADPDLLQECQRILQKTVDKLESEYSIPLFARRISFNIVYLQRCEQHKAMEMGANFTLGTTMFLRPITTEVEYWKRNVAHEGVHILQRMFPASFHSYYLQRYETRVVDIKVVDRIFRNQNEILIDNPDCSITDSTQYRVGKEGLIVFYTRDLQKALFNGYTGEFLGWKEMFNDLHHPHEMFAEEVEQF